MTYISPFHIHCEYCGVRCGTDPEWPATEEGQDAFAAHMRDAHPDVQESRPDTPEPEPIDWGWLDDILRGIDRGECGDDTGWWETSTGATFGARKLAELKAAITARYHTEDTP